MKQPDTSRIAALLTVFAITLIPTGAAGGPSIAPGDLALRHDIQRLVDAGVISGPVSSWPLAWGPVLADLRQIENPTGLPEDVQQALARVRAKAAWDTAIDQTRYRARAAAGANASRIRSFQNTPREDLEASVGLSWIGERFSADLNVTGVDNASDGETLRFDGSQLAMALGNYTLAASTLDRWWGPGWDGSLVLSNNARPMPAVTLDRNFTQPFDTRWLSWIGPWDLSLLWGFMEEERAVPNAQFLGFRVAFRPLSSLEIGISRTAQWCGDDRPCDLDTFWNLLTGNDNRGDELAPEDEPGNQTAALDFRWAMTPLNVPVAVYGQFMAEDEAGGFPSRYIGQLGIENYGQLSDRWSYRLYAEAVETTCNFYESDPGFNCAYNHGIYRTGYRYRGRSVGHGLDNDARVASLGFVLVNESGNSFQGIVRAGRLNRGGAADPANSLTPLPQDVLTVELIHNRVFRYGRLEFGLGYDRYDGSDVTDSSDDAKAFIQWRSDY
ncbi:MAG TPA: capsule assembly Wzi family protein [Woeseiaceae bacterium]